MTPSAIVQKPWNYCNVLRDDGMSYGDYPSTSLRAGSEQLTYLLFLKMADERTKPAYNQPSAVPAKYNWPTLLKKDGDDLFDHYRHMLESQDESLEASDNLPDPDVIADKNSSEFRAQSSECEDR